MRDTYRHLDGKGPLKIGSYEECIGELGGYIPGNWSIREWALSLMICQERGICPQGQSWDRAGEAPRRNICAWYKMNFKWSELSHVNVLPHAVVSSLIIGQVCTEHLDEYTFQ